jgi:hypothetical protein
MARSWLPIDAVPFTAVVKPLTAPKPILPCMLLDQMLVWFPSQIPDALIDLTFVQWLDAVLEVVVLKHIVLRKLL